VTSLHFPWLAALVLLPLLGAALVRRVRPPERAQRSTVWIMALTLALAVGAWRDFTQLSTPQAADPHVGALFSAKHAFLAIDEFSAPLLPLAALIYLLTTLTTLRTKIRRFSFSRTLVSLSLLLATLCSLEPWPIIGLVSISIVPMYLELKSRNRPTRVFLFHLGLSTLLLIAGWLVIQSGSPSRQTPWVFVPVVVAILIRGGIAPFHCWVADLFEHATFGRALLFVSPMLGAYVAVRLLLPLAPALVLEAVGLLALATAVYASSMALVQREARRFFCYIFLSHSALVSVGIDTARPLGLTGALCVWLSVALSLSGFGLTLRLLEARHGRLTLSGYHGLYEHTPLLAICFFLTGMASIGFPGTFGFLGSELLVEGALQGYPLVGGAVVVASALNGIAVVKSYFLLFTGTRHVSSVPLGIGMRERLAVLSLSALILGGGLFPQPGVASRYHAATSILSKRQATEEATPQHPQPKQATAK
jgi:NADH-quinone oxidoreductase subunit M